MGDIKEIHFHVKNREKFKTLPIEGWFHPCYRCYSVTGYEYFLVEEDTKYTYNLCYGCSLPPNFRIMKKKIIKYHKNIKLQEQIDDQS